MRYFALLIVLLAACSSNIGESPENTADARPINFREPPEPKEGSGSAPGCEGVTARGECQQGQAVYCDLDRGRLRKVDCEAMGQNCILDIGRGAVCDKVDQDPNGGSTTASACTDTNISETGFCTPDGTAVYCDTSGSEPVTRTWNCGSAGKSCEVGGCADGAFCCGGDDTTPDPGTDTCDGLDFNGTCDGQVAKWCGGGAPQEMDCAAQGKRCEVDTCATGAFCCGDAGTGGTTTPPPVDECSALGFAGECSGNTVRYCFNGEIQEVTCSGERTCQEDACIPGAGCCLPPATPPPVNECQTIGWDGVCSDSNTVRFCSGTEDTDILEFSCSAGKSCQVGVCGDGAQCCDDVDECAAVNGATGTCEGDTLKYCLGDTVTTVDCTAQGKTCQEDACLAGLAECC